MRSQMPPFIRSELVPRPGSVLLSPADLTGFYAFYNRLVLRVFMFLGIGSRGTAALLAQATHRAHFQRRSRWTWGPSAVFGTRRRTPRLHRLPVAQLLEGGGGAQHGRLVIAAADQHEADRQ